MRPFMARALALFLTFCCGLLITLLWVSLANRPLRQLARRVEQRFKTPYIKEGEKRYMKRLILLDKRNYWEAPDVARPVSNGYSDLEAVGKEEREMTNRIAPKLFQRSYLEHYGQCSRESRERPVESEADLVWAQEQGQFVPWVRDWHSGAFTEPGAFQYLHEITVGECNARQSSVAPTKLLAVFDRWDRLYASIKPLPGEGVVAVADVDGDDIEEVLLGRSELKGTRYITRMRLVSLKDGQLRVIHDFGVGYIFTFSEGLGDERVITIPVIYFTPRAVGETPEFHVDFYRASCSKAAGCGFMPRPTAWEYLKSGSIGEDE